MAMENLGIHHFETTSDKEQVILQILNCEPIEMEKHGEVFRVSLVLPIGEHQYKYNDGDTSRVTIEPHDYIIGEEQDELLLMINWSKTNDTGGYDLLHGNHDNTYTPTLSDIGALMKAEIDCFSVGTQLFSVYDISKPVVIGGPRCLDLKINGSPREGKTLVASYKYFGGTEGRSVMRWIGPNGRSETTKEYRIGLEDVDHSIRLEYTPVRNDGTRGETYTVDSEPILASIATAADLVIKGKVCEAETITVQYRYYGGREGNSLVQWYRIVDNQDVLIEGATSASYEIDTEDVKYKLKATVTPVSVKGEVGNKESITTIPVEPAPPQLKRVGMAGSAFEEGSKLEADYEYYGGTEGKSRFEWFRVRGEEKVVGGNDKVYELSIDDVGKQIELQVTPVRDDGVVGTPDNIRSDTNVTPAKPRVLAIALIGAYMQDSTLKLKVDYRGGFEGDSKVIWYRSRQQDVADDWVPIESANDQREYKLQIDDVFHFIKVEYIPVRDDGVQGKSKEEIGERVRAQDPVMKDVNIVCPYLVEGEVIRGNATFYGGHETDRHHKWLRIENGEQVEITGFTYSTYKLQTADVGHQIVYGVQPVRSDTTGAWAYSEPTDSVAPRKPQVKEISVQGEAVEGKEIYLTVSGTDVSEEQSKYQWVRVADDQEIELGSEKTQSIKHDDIGHVLKCYFTPVRGDFDVKAEPVSATSEIVQPGPPVVISLSITGTFEEGQQITVQSTYSGGDEGNSKIRWFRDDKPIDRFNDRKEYRLTLEDVGSIIKVEYEPVRKDDEKGEKKTAVTPKIGAAFPTVSDLKISGNPTEDSVLSATATYYGGVEGTSLWRWRRVDANGGTEMAMVETVEYKVQKKDIGCKIRFEYTPVRKDNVKGKIVTAETEFIKAKPPTISNVKIEGDPVVSGTLTVKGTYTGGVEGKSEVQWLVAEGGDFKQVSNELTFIPNADHVGLQVKAVYTPVRVDDVKGAPVESNAVEIGVTSSTIIEQLSNEKYEVTTGQVSIRAANKNLKLKNTANGKTLAEEKWENLDINIEGQKTLQIVVKKSGVVHPIECANYQERNIIAMVLRAYASLSNETVSKETMGASFSSSWKKEKRAQAFGALASETSQPVLSSATKGTRVLVALRKAK
jgi:hypothetical protein